MSAASLIRQNRSLRDAESLATRKRILKANAVTGGGPSGELFQELTDSGNSYLEKLEQLKKFKAKSKVVTKTNTQQSEWIAEQTQLRTLVMNCDRDVSGLLDILKLHSSSSENTTIMNDDNSYAGSIGSHSADNFLSDIECIESERFGYQSDIFDYTYTI
jgi:hypothetical protein